jgi:hypothetical protein
MACFYLFDVVSEILVTSNRKLSCACGSVWLARSICLRLARPPGARILGHRVEKIILDLVRSQAPNLVRSQAPDISRAELCSTP